MAQRIYWQFESDLTASSYSIHTLLGGAETLLATIPNSVPGPYWDATLRRFSFEDPQGTDSTIYRVRALGSMGELYGDTGPFLTSPARAAQLASRVRVDHNYPTPNNLQFATAAGQGVPDAIVRVFLASDWDANRREIALYTTTTVALGAWAQPLWLEPGMTYVILVEKPSAYTSEPRRIDVVL